MKKIIDESHEAAQILETLKATDKVTTKRELLENGFTMDSRKFSVRGITPAGSMPDFTKSKVKN